MSPSRVADEAGKPVAPTQSYMILLPIMLRGKWAVEDVSVVPSPWGAPLVTALVGKNDSGHPWLGIANEIPFSWLRVATPISKSELELLHLQRLAVDYRCATGNELYDAVTLVAPGDDPPDLYAHVDGGQVGWELTAFSNHQRRQAQALFFEITRRFSEQQRHRIGHLTGYHVSMWFGAADDPAGLPFKANDTGAYDRLVEALVAHRPDPDQYRVSGTEIPQQLTGAGPVRTPEDVNFMSVPLLGGVPASGLFSMTGMSMGLAFQSDHMASEEWSNLRKIITRKDRPSNDRLLISVGAPDSMGRCFLSEEVLAHFILDHPEAVSATYLSSVVLHFWSTGRAVELLGTAPRELWPALYQGVNPISHPFVSNPQP